MTALNLFDTAGRYIAPSAEIIATLTEAERTALDRIAEAAGALEAAKLAAKANGDKLAATQAEIAAIEKVIPKITFNDLAKAMAAETQKRRAGL